MVNTVQELLELLNLDPNIYSDYVQFNDGTIGFSVVRKYSEDITRTLVLKKNDFTEGCRIWIQLYNDSVNQCYKLRIRITSLNHVDGFAINNRDEFNFKRYEPFNFTDDSTYVYDGKSNTISEKNSNKFLNGNEIIERIFKKHTLPCKSFTGFFIRNYTAILFGVYKSSGFLINLIDKILFVCFGKKLSRQLRDEFEAAYFHFYGDLKPISYKNLETHNQINAFNLKTTYNSVVFSSLLVLAAFILSKFDFLPHLGISKIWFLQPIFWIILIFIVDILIPYFLLIIINRIISIKRIMYIKLIRE